LLTLLTFYNKRFFNLGEEGEIHTVLVKLFEVSNSFFS
jgi:hypothetical protein